MQVKVHNYSATYLVTKLCILLFLDHTCPDDCTDPSQGTCDITTGQCSCELGFVGDNCGLAGNIKIFAHFTNYSFKPDFMVISLF